MINKFLSNIDQVIIGKQAVVSKVLIALLAEGHVLIEDVPGVGKTTLAKAVAKSIDCSFSRIQFTPDLLPSDILGVSVYNQKALDFVYKKGPIYAHVVLADEINRASPKTQSSLLEAMEERQVTMDGNTYKLEEPFIVMATQNPIEYEGTFPLPEAQLDRFMIKIQIGYPEELHELRIFDKIDQQIKAEDLMPVLTAEEIRNMRSEVSKIHMAEEIESYIFSIIRATRQNDDIILGCSPRAAIALYKASKARAYTENRDFVIPEDVQILAADVLSHRIVLKPEVKYKGETGRSMIDKIMNVTKAPRMKQK
ncbi:MoxR family ATPase [Acidaminobacter sp. JC074]|uniref:AAA family ATPase n=1 Tax=Acidaminobacter sp. JC074 TaxID=2530199 RepID=UPI001F117C75|nr:MoxR family ATPase [Acidaminobacter sp. JC074]MCH4891361.1 MoxR family ATPase [Acidaminobacter sp. JC074]